MPGDGDEVEHFLVDGVAPSVIGGGPPESPYDLQPDPEPEPRHHPQAHGPTPTGPPQHGPGRPHAEYHERPEPPTSPIPVINPLPPEPEKRKSWVSKVFRLPG